MFTIGTGFVQEGDSGERYGKILVWVCCPRMLTGFPRNGTGTCMKRVGGSSARVCGVMEQMYTEFQFDSARNKRNRGHRDLNWQLLCTLILK